MYKTEVLWVVFFFVHFSLNNCKFEALCENLVLFISVYYIFSATYLSKETLNHKKKNTCLIIFIKFEILYLDMLKNSINGQLMNYEI